MTSVLERRDELDEHFLLKAYICWAYVSGSRLFKDSDLRGRGPHRVGQRNGVSGQRPSSPARGKDPNPSSIGILEGVGSLLGDLVLLFAAVNQWRLTEFGRLDPTHTMRWVIPGARLTALEYR